MKTLKNYSQKKRTKKKFLVRVKARIYKGGSTHYSPQTKTKLNRQFRAFGLTLVQSSALWCRTLLVVRSWGMNGIVNTLVSEG